MSVRICAKQLATATITHLRLVGGTAQTRRGRVVVNSPSYSQAEGIFRTYFGQEWGDPHSRGFHELLRGVVDVAPLATFGLVNIEQTMADTLLRGWREGHFIRYRLLVIGKL